MKLEKITRPASDMLDQILGALPGSLQPLGADGPRKLGMEPLAVARVERGNPRVDGARHGSQLCSDLIGSAGHRLVLSFASPLPMVSWGLA